MQNYAINNKLTPFISMQNHYNLVYREEEREMLPMLKVCMISPSPISLTYASLSRSALRRRMHPVVSAGPWRPDPPPFQSEGVYTCKQRCVRSS